MKDIGNLKNIFAVAKVSNRIGWIKLNKTRGHKKKKMHEFENHLLCFAINKIRTSYKLNWTQYDDGTVPFLFE